jgi:hypothetical protein
MVIPEQDTAVSLVKSPVKHRQSHLVDPTIDRSRGQYCRDRDCRIGDAFLGMYLR